MKKIQNIYGKININYDSMTEEDIQITKEK